MSDKGDRPVERPEWANTTSTQMLAGARSGDPDSWAKMVRLYAPLVLLWCRRRGLCGPCSQDATDVVQEVFKTVCKRIAEFTKDGEPAAFRRWLKTIFNFKMREYLRIRRNVALDPAVLDEASAPEDPADTDGGDDGGIILILRRLLELVRLEFHVRTWEAFWKVAVEGRSPKEVATELDMTVPAVYTAKSKVLKRLRDEAEALGFERAEGDVVTADIAGAVQREVTS